MYILLANATTSLTIEAILTTAVYAVMGTVILMLAYKVFDLINPLDFDKELSQNNLALGVMIAGFFISVAIIIMSAVLG